MPRVRRASTTPAQAPKTGQAKRNQIKTKDICVGCIVWLPPKVDADSEDICNRPNCCTEALDDGGYDHPVVVVGIKQREGSSVRGDIVCTVACVTSFGDRSLSSHISHRRRSSQSQLSIPIYHPNAEDSSIDLETGPEQLYLENGGLHKQSYVRLGHTYAMPAAQLRQYKHTPVYNVRLTAASYRLLVTKLQMEADDYVDTVSVPLTGRIRLSALADDGIRSSTMETRTTTTIPGAWPHTESETIPDDAVRPHVARPVPPRTSPTSWAGRAANARPSPPLPPPPSNTVPNIRYASNNYGPTPVTVQPSRYPLQPPNHSSANYGTIPSSTHNVPIWAAPQIPYAAQTPRDYAAASAILPPRPLSRSYIPPLDRSHSYSHPRNEDDGAFGAVIAIGLVLFVALAWWYLA